MKPKQVFRETAKNLFQEDSQDENIYLHDDQIEESIIQGASLSDDGLSDSDDSYGKISRRSEHVIPEEYASLGSPSVKCTKCNARMWKEERINKNVTRGTPVFSMCCKKGDVKLPPTPPTPSYLTEHYNDESKSAAFQRNIRCLRHDKHLIFSKDTKIDETEEKGTSIPYETFDFYDHGELRSPADQKTYLTVGDRVLLKSSQPLKPPYVACAHNLESNYKRNWKVEYMARAHWYYRPHDLSKGGMGSANAGRFTILSYRSVDGTMLSLQIKLIPLVVFAGFKKLQVGDEEFYKMRDMYGACEQ
ncbi:hypothetical protein POM88_023519 [Heracleum sosnowskyi]|uniref:BAH domain-containing protein n=1 Tax=Heracleum sosnowskyi TaxID=360622 RepID=A0AAD8IIX9_9APIA|nr:hypothetical protein POM88_023519 [Heracleum sosnowskyi]